LSNVLAMAAGGYHSLALEAGGTVVAWGAGTNNTGSSPNLGQAQVPAGLSNVVAVAAGGYHSLALEAGGTVVAWGAGTNNTGSSPNLGQAQVPSGLSNVVAVAAGGYHSLALKADGTVVAWGAGTTNTGSIPNFGQAIVPAGLTGVVAVAAGVYHSLALKADGTMVAWGAGVTNKPGNLYIAGEAMVPAGLTNVIALAGGSSHTLVLEGDGRPNLTTQPVSQTVLAGATVVYAAMAVGNPPLSYQWRFNGSNLSDATASSFTTNNVQIASAGSYSVVVTNACGVAVSSNAVLSVNLPPGITNQPASQTVLMGSNVTFSVGVSGSTPLSYQWQFNGGNLSDATASSFTTNNVQIASAGSYSVVVTNAYGAVVSSNAVLTVLLPMPPDILTAPAFGVGGLFQFNLAGAAGSNYVIAASTNLTDWLPLETNTSPFTFADTNAMNFPLRFYRAQPSP
jgi:hypothetical protein